MKGVVGDNDARNFERTAQCANSNAPSPRKNVVLGIVFYGPTSQSFQFRATQNQCQRQPIARILRVAPMQVRNNMVHKLETEWNRKLAHLSA